VNSIRGVRKQHMVHNACRAQKSTMNLRGARRPVADLRAATSLPLAQRYFLF
jgi:urease alpha subunit